MILKIIRNFVFTEKGIAVFLFLIYLVFAVIYSFERILNVDNSFFFFEIINQKNFSFIDKREGVWFSQLPLLSMIFTGCSLKSLLYSFSLGFVLEYAIIIFICLFWLRNPEAGLAVILSLILGISQSFYHPVTETHQALAFSAFFYALISFPCSGTKQKWWFFLIQVLILVWTLLIHPISVFTTIFIIVFSSIKDKNTGLSRIALFLISLLFGFIRPLLASKTSYDQGLYSQLFESWKLIPQFFQLYPYLFIKTKLLNLYLPVVIFAVISIIYGLKKQKLSLLFFTLASFMFFCFITILTFNTGDSDNMMEKSFMPASFIFILLFLHFLFNEKGYLKNVFLGIVLLAGIFALSKIQHSAKVFTQRLNAIEDFSQLHQKEDPKLILNFSDLPEHLSRHNHWATAYDALILSTIKTGRSTTFYLCENKTEFQFNSQDSSLFLAVPFWSHRSTNELNHNYFNLEKVPYKVYQPKN